MDIPSSTIKPGRLTYSCIRCANRKVKCDRQQPCGACVKHNVECIFNKSHSTRKKAKRVKVKALTEQLNHYKTLLHEHSIGTGIDRRDDRMTHHPQDPQERPQLRAAHQVDAEHRYVNTTRSIGGQVYLKFVENSLWTKVIEESNDAGLVSEGSDSSSDSDTSEDDFAFVLARRPKLKKRPSHPPFEHIHLLWKAFLENVDPLTKIVHVPTLRGPFLRASENPSNVPRNLEALMFSIYSTAIMSLQDEDCKEQFSEDRTTLLARYISATETALSRANFMATTSLVILQTLLLHLSAVRDIYEPRAVWSLTGVAVRIAQVMGLERDGEYLNLPPFETEIRRRIWWQLKLHDFRAAELCGLAKYRDLDLGEESTKWPTSINDNEMHPSMSSLVQATNGITDSVFLNLRCTFTEFASHRVAFFRQQGKNSSRWNLDAFMPCDSGMEKIINDLENTLETQYVRYCDPSQPLHLLAMVMARYAMNTVRFLAHHPRSWSEETPLSERQEIWRICVALLEQHSMVKTNPLIKGFAWHAVYFQQFHAFIHVLDTLRAEPLHPDSEKVWRLVGIIYYTTPIMITDTKKPIYAAVGNLCLKAYGAREAAIQQTNTYAPPAPDFITKLRNKHHEAKLKREARNAKIRPVVQARDPAKTWNQNQKQNQDVLLNSIPIVQTSLPYNNVPGAIVSDDSSIFTEGDQSSFMNEFNFPDTLSENVLDMDLDTLLALDHNIDSNDSGAIDWKQWDAWLSESNAMRPT